MSKLKKKYLKLDNTADGVNAQVLPTSYTPTNYTNTDSFTKGHIQGIDNKLGEIIEANQVENNTGFYSWAGGAPYYSQTFQNALTVAQGGTGYINNKKITWTSGSTGTFAANTLNYVYVDINGIIQSTTNPVGLYENNIVLFEVLYDGIVGTVVKENHPVKFDRSVDSYLHNYVGTIVQGTGAVIAKIGTGNGTSVNDRKIKIVGNDVLQDHGLSTTISDTGGSAVSFRTFYTNASGKWIYFSSGDEIPRSYNNAGTMTAISNGRFATFRVYVSKDDLNSSSPTYYLVAHTQDFANLSSARSAITNGIAQATNELKGLEFAQLGYIIVEQNVNNGYIAEVQVAQDTLRTSVTGAASTNTANLISVNTTTFTKNLTSSDTTVQTALETIDQLTFPIASSGDLNQTSFAMTSSATNAPITGFAFNNASVRSFKALLSVSIDATTDLFEVFEILAIQKASGWDWNVSSTGDVSGVTLSIDSSGQVQYSVSSISGFVSGTMKFRAQVTNI